MADQCSNCDYVRPRTYGTSQVLECRFPVPRQQGQKGHWPEVLGTDWCGEYQIIGFSDPTNLAIQGVTLNTTTKTKVIETEAGHVLWVTGGNATNASINKGVTIKFFDGDTDKIIGVTSLAASQSHGGSFIPPLYAEQGSVWAQLDISDGSDVYVYLQGRKGRAVEVMPA